MRAVIIDGKQLTDQEKLHDIFSEKLQFPAYYGRNMDALHDCLADIHDETVITILNREHVRHNLGGYAEILKKVLQDAEKENPNLRII